MNYHWNWGIFLEQVKAGDETYLAWLFTGLGWTLAVSLTAWLIALTIGIAVGALRTAPALFAADAPARGLPAPGQAWVDERLATGLGVRIGDPVEVGEARFTVAAIMTFEGERGGNFMAPLPIPLLK